jgi:hypothetical protein
MTSLHQYDIPNKHTLIEQSLQEIYDNSHLAELPPITVETTLRVALDNVTNDPALSLRIFDSALEYNDGTAEQFDDKYLFRDQVRVNFKDVKDCWSAACLAAIVNLKNLTKGMDLILRAKAMINSNKSSSRLTPHSMRRPYIFSRLMRLCQDKQDWNAAISTWSLFFGEVKKANRLADGPSQEHLIYNFLNLAYKMDKDSKEDGNYCRTALDLVEKDVGLSSADLFIVSENNLKDNKRDKLQESAFKNKDEIVAFAIEYVKTVRLVCRRALDTGEQGIDLASKDQVEKWKDLRKRAAQLRELGEGTSFDDEEADWLRSGAKGKSSLALSDEDMRELSA